MTATQPFATDCINGNRENFRYDLVWEKHTPTGYLNCSRMPMRSHENILVFYDKLPTYNPQKTKGVPYVAKHSASRDSLNYGTTKNITQTTVNETGDRFPRSIVKVNHDKEKLHTTQKPVELFEWLIKTYTNEGETVLDPFGGSGTTGVACLNTNRNFILIEKEQKYYDIILERLK